MDQSTTTRIVRHYRAAHRAPAADVFALLCPVREYDWIEPWQCMLIHSASGVAELDCVFKTDFAQNGGPETWTCSCYDPPRRIDYVIVGAHRVTRLSILLDEAGGGGCNSVWTRVYTALDEKGARLLAGIDEATYAAQHAALERMLNHYLATGARLTLDAALGAASAHMDEPG